MGGIYSSLAPEAVMAIVCVGVDLAKHVFVTQGVDDAGKAVGASSGTNLGSPCHSLDPRGQ